MQLIKIKIAGFKSFVDPTTILLPGNMVAIVGPNGCGKSNIIDAVTWVMGESSPKYLRGEALTDVIFNGSSARKPVGQASVELIFDNSDAAIGGEYAQYSEISVKRVINRDSDSTYYLNNTRCRKRDIVGIFLGTGLGPRSYSIIGQNMISRIIEAKPDDLRSYLEEAAGISKYKERRHETELRISHTKENLARVFDVKNELETQLNHLKHQANVAEKFKVLKEQERLIRGELLATEWREVDSRLVQFTLKIQHDETALEAKQSGLISTDNELNHLRNEKRMAQDAYQEIQRRFYAVGNEITRIEQDVLHHEERKKQWELDLKQTDHDWELIKAQILTSEETLVQLEETIHSITPSYDKKKMLLKRLEEEFNEAEDQLNEWETKWDDFNAQSAKARETSQVEKMRIQQLQERLKAIKSRQNQLSKEEDRYQFNEIEKEITDLQNSEARLIKLIKQQETSIEDNHKNLANYRLEKQQLEKELNEQRSKLQRHEGQLASLTALQETALGREDSNAQNWLKTHQLSDKSRLAQLMEVEKPWENVVEKVLGLHLQAICLNDTKEVLPFLSDLPTGKLAFVTDNKTHSNDRNNPVPHLERLLDKITTSLPLEGILASIYIAPDVATALKNLPELAIHESFVTSDGIWIGHSWIKVLRDLDPTIGVFEREKKIKELSNEIDEARLKIEKITQNLTQIEKLIHDHEDEREKLRKVLQEKQAELANVKAMSSSKTAQITHLKNEHARYLKELSDCSEQIQQLENEVAKATDKLNEALIQLEKNNEDYEQVKNKRETIRKNYQMVRENYDNEKDLLHELEIQLKTAKSREEGLRETIARLKQQINILHERKVTLQSELASIPAMDALQTTLTRALDQHVNVEAELNTSRSAMDTLEQEMQFLEEKRHQLEQESNQIRNSLENLRVESQGFRVKIETILEQLKESNSVLEEILPSLPMEATTDAWRQKLDQINNRIHRLGPINLMAIDEYNNGLERKTYIDQQLADLQSGLQTLEEAIAKIDRETKIRFKETFDKVNARFQELFPTVFGGGKAHLELTNDNLLEAGVTVMACPPGKRNSTIYLLSGGEKSLTAIALIFSIFHLNPAPFCLLDEVDAALDDTNVVRFTRLVKAMADKTQFIFISHNKITIEMGEHLIGVTMNEPGVSRLVTVDIHKAISLAGT